MNKTDNEPQAATVSKRNLSVTVAAVSVFLNFTGFTLILPVIPFLVGQYVPPDQLGLYVGLIVSAYAFFAFCAAPVLGALSDRYGRRPILILSLLGSAAGYLIFGLGGALWVLFAGRIIDGITAGNISTVYAYIADTSAPAERGRIYGLLGAVGGLGFMMGPVAGGLLGALFPTAPLFAASLLTLCNAAWVYFALPESVKRDATREVWQWRQINPLVQIADVLRHASLRLPFAVAFSFFLAATILHSNFSVYLKDIMDFGPMGIGWTLFGVGVMDIVSQGFLSRLLLPRIGANALTKSGSVINACGFLLVACMVYVPTIGFLLFALAVLTLGDGLFQPAMNTIIANAAPPGMQGLVQGANQSQQSLARMLGPMLAAFLSPITANTPYWVGALIVMSSVLLLSVSKKEQSRPEA